MFDTTPALNRIVEIVTALPGVQNVYIGVPNQVKGAGACYITLGRQRVIDKANQALQRELRFILTFCYAVDGAAVEGAERAIAEAVDALIDAVWLETENGASPLKDLIELDMSLSDTAEYQVNVGQEFRRYPVGVSYIQQTLIGA